MPHSERERVQAAFAASPCTKLTSFWEFIKDAVKPRLFLILFCLVFAVRSANMFGIVFPIIAFASLHLPPE